MKPIFTPIFFLLFIIKINAFNTPPSIADIPIQVMSLDGTFSPLNLNDYLTEPDGDEVEWSYYYTNTLSNGEQANWGDPNTALNMTIFAKVNIRGEYPNSSGDILAAFNGDELKGKANAIQVGPDWLFFLTIQGEQEEISDSITFKYYDADQTTIFEVDDTVTFGSQKTLGEANNPYIMNAGFISILEEGQSNIGILYPRAYDYSTFKTDTVYVVVREKTILKSLADTTMVIFSTINNLLPLELISFTVKEVETKAQLRWLIQSPENVFGFEIERGQIKDDFGTFIWESIDFVPFGEHQFVYQYLDKVPFDGINYYRLKIIDFDSSFEYSPVVSVLFEKLEDHSIHLFPNPVMNNQQLFISIDSETISDVNLQIFSQTGELIKQYTYLLNNNDRFLIDLHDFPNGFYIIKVKIGHQNFERSFIVLSD